MATPSCMVFCSLHIGISAEAYIFIVMTHTIFTNSVTSRLISMYIDTSIRRKHLSLNSYKWNLRSDRPDKLAQIFTEYELFPAISNPILSRILVTCPQNFRNKWDNAPNMTIFIKGVSRKNDPKIIRTLRKRCIEYRFALIGYYQKRYNLLEGSRR